MKIIYAYIQGIDDYALTSSKRGTLTYRNDCSTTSGRESLSNDNMLSIGNLGIDMVCLVLLNPLKYLTHLFVVIIISLFIHFITFELHIRTLLAENIRSI